MTIMKALVRADSMGDITIHIEGGLDYENYVYLKKELEEITVQNPGSMVTLDLHKMDFVGSSGIGLFVETLRLLNKKHNKVRLTNVKKEFLKVFKLYESNIMDSIIDDFESDETKHLGQRLGKRTFQN